MPSPETVAVIDVGSNSIKLLVAKPGLTAGSVEAIFAETIETRISTGISQALPSLTEAAMTAGCRTIIELVRLAQGYQPKSLRIVATSAVRDATNAIQFIELVFEATGLEIQILSGAEEATYIGTGLRCDPQIAGIHNFIQMDLGGGSLELIRFAHGHIEQALSLQLGAVRLTEQFIADRAAALATDTDTAARIAAHVCEALQASGFSFEPDAGPLIVTGGALTVTRAVLAAQNDQTIEQRCPVLHKQEITQLKAILMALPLHERMAVPHLPAARADIIPAALITIDSVLEYAVRDRVTHSFYNLRYGIAAELLCERAEAMPEY
jgi:exopolyphosphatase/guanosine-5'-triphosphate,3'-diphosphate pyrophosphatase